MGEDPVDDVRVARGVEKTSVSVDLGGGTYTSLGTGGAALIGTVSTGEGSSAARDAGSAGGGGCDVVLVLAMLVEVLCEVERWGRGNNDIGGELVATREGERG